MSEEIDKLSVLIAGTYTDTDAYPNVHHRIKTLEACEKLQVTKYNFSSSTKIDYASRSSKLRSILQITWLLVLQTIRCLLAIKKNRKHKVLYIPYPAIFILLGLKLMPRVWAPRRVIADCFISVFDTLVIDRELVSRRSLFARFLRLLEKSAIERADRVVVDTSESAEHFSRILQTERRKFVDVPLAINENVFVHSPYIPDDKTTLKVIFIGTLVPLHKISTLLDAVKILADKQDVSVKIVGDGQQAYLIENFIKSNTDILDTSKFVWIREWQTSEQLQEHIKHSDVCLGIMGMSGKSDRVWPFKNYLYMATGRAVITAGTTTANRMASMSCDPFFFKLEKCTGEELATLLTNLSKSPLYIQSIATNARSFFEKNLAKDKSRRQLLTILADRK